MKDGATRVLFARDDIPGFNDLFTDAAGPRVHRLDALEPVRRQPMRRASSAIATGSTARARRAWLYGGVSLTNGIGFSPDGRRIYHSDSARGLVLVHELDAAGRAKPLTPIRVEGGPDGLAIDAEGGVWVALYEAGAVARFKPDGSPDRASRSRRRPSPVCVSAVRTCATCTS